MAVAPPPLVSRAPAVDVFATTSEDDYGFDAMELARACDELRVVVSRVQARLSADRRVLIAEREALAVERSMAVADRNRVERTLCAIEQAVVALAPNGRSEVFVVSPSSINGSSNKQTSATATREADVLIERAVVLPSSSAASPPPMPSRNPPPMPERRQPQSEETSEEIVVPATSPEEKPEHCAGAKQACFVAKDVAQTTARVSPIDGVPVAARRFKEPPAKLKQIAPQVTAGLASAEGNRLLVKDPPVQCVVKEPACRMAKSHPVSPLASSQPSLPSAPASLPSAPVSASPTPAEDIERGSERCLNDEQDEGEDTAHWLAELDVPPSKSPPPQSPFYRVMPAPPGAEYLGHPMELPPEAETPSEPQSLPPEQSTPVRHKAMPARGTPKALPNSAPLACGTSQQEGGSPEELQQPVEQQLLEQPAHHSEQPQQHLDPQGARGLPPAQASASSGAPPKSRYKAPPSGLVATRDVQDSSRSGIEERSLENTGGDAWGEWRGTSMQRGASGTQSLPASRMKAAPCAGALPPAPPAASPPHR